MTIVPTDKEHTVSTLRPHSSRQRATRILVMAAGAAVLTACGSSASGGGTNDPVGSSAGGAGRSLTFSMRPIAGKVASVGSAGVKVTTSKGTSDVAFGTSTRFTEVSTTTRSALKVGECVAIGSTTRSANANPVAASTVTITRDSACKAPTIGPRGTPPRGTAGAATPPFTGNGGTAPPYGGPAGGGRSFGPGSRGPGTGFGRPGGPGGMGTVTSVSASSFDIKSLGTKATTKVTTSSATVYRKEATAKASDVTTGRCISAFGRPAGSVVDAFSVTISSPSNGQCKTAATTAGPGGFGGGPRGGPTGEGRGTTYG